MREKSERESERELEGVRGCWQWERARESKRELERQASRANREKER